MVELTNIFEVATKNKYRFPFKGLISVEDLWDLKLQDLDSVFKALNKQKKVRSEESLLDEKTTEDVELDEKIQIVKFIVKYKQDEIATRSTEKEIKMHNQKIMELIERKKDEKLEKMSIEELMSQLK